MGWVIWVEDYGVVVEDLVIGIGVDVVFLEVGVVMVVMVVVEVMEVVEVVEVLEDVGVMVVVVLEVVVLEFFVLEVDLYLLEVDFGYFLMKGVVNLMWVFKVFLIMFMMKNCY